MSVSTYRLNVVRRTFIESAPDFALLLDARDEDWPTLELANQRLERCLDAHQKEKGEVVSEYAAFVRFLLGSADCYEVAKQMGKVLGALRQGDISGVKELWTLKTLLMSMPTVLSSFPQSLLNAMRAVERPRFTDEWGVIQLGPSHNIKCAVCNKRVSRSLVRVRCGCFQFGRFVHEACIQEEKCFVCSKGFLVTNIVHHGAGP